MYGEERERERERTNSVRYGHRYRDQRYDNAFFLKKNLGYRYSCGVH